MRNNKCISIGREKILKHQVNACIILRKTPIDYRFFCGHDIQSEDDMDALDYYIIGVWLIQHRRYTDWSDRKSFDLAEVLEFMRIYGIRIPRYMKRTRFYRKKKDQLLKILNGSFTHVHPT